MKFDKKKRQILLLILITTILGFASKFYEGTFELWVNNSLSGMFYEIFWCLVAFLFFNNYLSISIIVFIVTCILEFLQLWHPVFLEYIRNSFIGRTLIGNSFSYNDFIYYFIGCLISYVIMKKINDFYYKTSS